MPLIGLPLTRIFQGTRLDCGHVVDEIADAVWALEVPSPGGGRATRPGRT